MDDSLDFGEAEEHDESRPALLALDYQPHARELLATGDPVHGQWGYEAEEHFWDGVVLSVLQTPGGEVCYTVFYSDGDVEFFKKARAAAARRGCPGV